MPILGVMFAPLLVFVLSLQTDSARCDTRAPRSAMPYDSARALALAGEYDLVLVTTTPRLRKPRVDAHLTLTQTDEIRRATVAPLSGVGPRVRGLERPLWGWVTSSERIADGLSRQDPDNPAAVLTVDGRLMLRPGRQFHLELQIGRTSADGFWGRWSEQYGLTPVVVTDSKWTGPAKGFFCAMRRTQTKQPGT
jgi:hypothetical protein